MPAQPRIRYKTAKKVIVHDGIRFASAGEGERYLELVIARLKGEIRDFTLQPRFEIQPAFDKNGTHFRKIEYFADFKVVRLDGKVLIEDVKGWHGFSTPEFKLKKKLVEYRFPHISIVEVRRSGGVKKVAALVAALEELRHDDGRRYQCH
jgi:hypothetical protein